MRFGLVGVRSGFKFVDLADRKAGDTGNQIGRKSFMEHTFCVIYFWLYNKSWGKEQKSGQSKPKQVKWKCKNPQPEEGILCPRKIIAQNS